MLNFLYKREKNLEFELESQIIKSMCIVNNKYLLIGKLDGFLLIHEIEKNCLIYEGKISDSINCLLAYEEDSTKFFACLETPEIYLLELNKINNEIKINLILKYDDFHELCVKKLKSLGNNTFASCSADSSFVIWNIEGNILHKLKDQSHGLENFILKQKDNTISNLITLNDKGSLSFYRNVNNELFLSKVILEIDYTNSYSMSEISTDKIFVGGFSIIQIYSIKSEQLLSSIKIKEPISFIFEKEKKFIVFGLKNGYLEFRDPKKLNILGEKDIKQMENKFKFSKLFENGKIQLFKNESIIHFDFFKDKLICISDERVRFWNCSEEKKKNFLFF
jgi:WD40 repeat protein